MGEGLAFYEAAAQIIPLLFLTLVLEMGLVRLGDSEGESDEPWWQQIQTLISWFAIVAVFVGVEAVALRVLHEGEASARQEETVIAGLALAGFFLIVRLSVLYLRSVGTLAVRIVELVSIVALVGAVVYLLAFGE